MAVDYTITPPTSGTARTQEISLWTDLSDTVADVNNRLTTAEAGGATALNGLTDVDTATVPPTDGQALVWEAASSLWKPATVGGGAAASTLYTGTLTADVAIAAGAIQTILTTDSLPIGKYRFHVWANIAVNGNDDYDLRVAVGTATATFTGQVIESEWFNSGTRGTLTVDCIVNVTAAGTLVVNVDSNVTACTAKANSTGNANPGVTGWFAEGIGV